MPPGPSLIARSLIGLSLVVLAGCHRAATCPQGAGAESGKGAVSVAAPRKAALPEGYVKLPQRAANEAYEAVRADLWTRQLPRLFKDYQRVHFFDGPLMDQLADGMAMPITVLEHGIVGQRLIWSQRPHEGSSMVAMMFGPDNRLEAVAVAGDDCPPRPEDCQGLPGIVIYAPRGKASPDVIEPLTAWGRSNGADRKKPDRIVELP